MLPKIIKYSIIITVVCVVIGYTYFAFRDYIYGPSIVVFEPANGSTVSTSTVIIKGQGVRIQDITLNGRPLFIDDSGNFTETILLFPGYNVSLIQASDKFNRTTEYKLELVYKDKP